MGAEKGSRKTNLIGAIGSRFSRNKLTNVGAGTKPKKLASALICGNAKRKPKRLPNLSKAGVVMDAKRRATDAGPPVVMCGKVTRERPKKPKANPRGVVRYVKIANRALKKRVKDASPNNKRRRLHVAFFGDNCGWM
jgi:hypothetical protein